MRVRKWTLTLLGLTLGLVFLIGSAGQNALRPLELDAAPAPFPGNGQGDFQPVAAAQWVGDDDDDDEHADDEDDLDYRGVIASLSDTQLVLEDGTTFVTNAQTRFETGIAVGSAVEIEAKLMALAIDPADAQQAETEFRGVVTSMIVVLDDGTAFIVNDQTEFESEAGIGTQVDIDARLLAVEVEFAD